MSALQLKPAGIWERLLSLFSPRHLTAEVRTEVLANGQVQATPIFTVGKSEVDPAQIRPTVVQTILGHRVILDAPGREVLEKTRGKPIRISKKRAAEFLSALERDGVPVRSKDGRSRPRWSSVTANVAASLNPDDTLTVLSEIVAPDGVVIEKPLDFEQLKQDEGWYSVGEDLVKLPITQSAIDQVLYVGAESATLAGESVPRFLKALDDHRAVVGDVEKNAALEQRSIFVDKLLNSVRVDGNAERITVSTARVFTGKEDQSYEVSPAEIEEFAEREGYLWIDDGWVAVDPSTVESHRRARAELVDKLGDGAEIRGVAIPEALVSLKAAKDGGWNSPWTVYFSKAVTDSHRLIETPADVQFNLNLVESDGQSLFELDPIYNHERFKITHVEAEQAVAADERWIRKRGAWVKIDAEKFKRIADGIDQLGLGRTPTGFTFKASDRERVLEVFTVLGTEQHSEAYDNYLMKLADFTKIEDVPLPDGLRRDIKLRPYQMHGYYWLAFLHKYGLNGVLADDMGLGKTLQSLTMIQRADELAVSKWPSLIICPTSVVTNWRTEADKFLVGKHVVVYHGADRGAKLLQSQPSTLVITSYDIARLDSRILSEIAWRYVVLDEGHYIKNPDADRSKAIKTINGRHKLLLTGTPIQNNLEELWSLFDFVMPNYLGSRADFRRRYGRGRKVNWDAVHHGEQPLKPRINPFILRRLKEQVATDLPKKAIVHVTVELSPKQVELYKRVAEEARSELLDLKSDAEVDRKRPEVLAALTKLRTICNHPALAEKPNFGDRFKYSDSGKMKRLIELMEEVIEGEHRTLLFGQSTRMLDIIERCFTKKNIRMSRIDGATPANRRARLVEEFNGDDKISCFLISTKAGGTGLNLTGADTVVFYDHDWNPANDNQAEDRAHRIGQTRPVTVYKLISQGTIEEMILERQLGKTITAQGILGNDAEGRKVLTREDLLTLFTLKPGSVPD